MAEKLVEQLVTDLDQLFLSPHTEKVQRKPGFRLFHLLCFNNYYYFVMLSQKQYVLFVIFLFHLLGPVEVFFRLWHDTM